MFWYVVNVGDQKYIKDGFFKFTFILGCNFFKSAK
jgi:hypothetical protein